MPRGVNRYDEAALQRRLWSPDLLEPRAWFDAADLSTLSFGTGISAWRDRMGRGVNLEQATDAHQPTLVEGPNGRRVVNFDGTNDRLTTASWITTGYSGLTVALVPKWTTTGSGTSTIQALLDNDHGVSTSTGRGFVMQDRPDQANRPLTYGYLNPASSALNFVSDTTTTGNGTWRIVIGRSDFVTSVLRRDGAERASISQTHGISVQAVFHLGCWNAFATGVATNPSRFFNGQLAEVLVWPRGLSSRECELVEGYLAWKWGLVSILSSTHPFARQPPTI